MGIRILKGGMMTTVQDLGRYGYQSQGFSVAGVMDVRSFKIANLLLDNPENEAVLEITLIGPTLEFTSATIIAITGGDFQPTINGEPAPMYTALYMNKGDVLKFGSARTGSRGYIAFSSYLDIPVVMGSRCTNLKSGLGGFKGRKLEADDYIGFRIKRRYLPFFLSRKLDMDEFDQTEATLRVVMGPQDGMFSKQGIQTFLGSEYTVTNEFDRMGCRLECQFGCKLKKVVKGIVRNYRKELARRQAKEVSFCELPEIVVEKLIVWDDYESEYTTFDVCGTEIRVLDEELAEALKQLPEQSRNIVLMFFFLDMSDSEIGEKLNINRSTSYRHRRNSLEEIRKQLKEKKQDEE